MKQVYKIKASALLRSFLLAVFAINIAACAALQTSKTPTPPLRLGFTQRWGDYTLVAAQKQKLFEKYGVKVELIYYETLSSIYPDLASGQIDGAIMAIGDIINVNRNAEMKAVAVSDNGGNAAIVARANINTVEDLKGEKIGVLIGSQFDLMVTDMLRSAAISSNDVSLITVNPEDAVSVLKNNQVQAVFTYEPFLSDAIADGNKILYPDEPKNLFPNMIVFRKSITDKRPNDIRAFLQAWFDAVEYRAQNPVQINLIAANYTNRDIGDVKQDEYLKIYTLIDNKVLFNVQGENSVFTTAKQTIDYLISIGVISQMVDPLVLLDPTYLP